MGDVTKLPKWAQERIALLEMRLAQRTAERDEARATLSGKAEGCTYFALDGMGKIGIAGAWGVRVQSQDRPYLDVRWVENGGYFDLNGDGPIKIEPRASNAVWIRVR